MEFEVGDTYKCPEGHESKIVWINEDGNVIAVKYPQRHFNKVEKVVNHSEPVMSRRFRTK